MIETSEATQVCTSCGEPRPIQWFRRRDRGQRRHRQCRECRNSFERQRRAAREARDLEAFVREVRQSKDLGQVALLVKGILRRFGGAEGLAEFWVRQVGIASVLNPGNRTVLHHLEAIARLMALSSIPANMPGLVLSGGTKD